MSQIGAATQQNGLFSYHLLGIMRRKIRECWGKIRRSREKSKMKREQRKNAREQGAKSENVKLTRSKDPSP